jgi:hypothetical protein
LYFFGDFFEIFSILEVEIGRKGPGILGVNHFIALHGAHKEILSHLVRLPTFRLPLACYSHQWQWKLSPTRPDLPLWTQVF